MPRNRPMMLIALPLILTSFPSFAAQTARSGESLVANATASELSYADLADLALAAPIAAHVELTRIKRLKAEQASGLAPGKTRFLIEAQLISLIRGATGMPMRVTYLIDLPNGQSGKPPRIRKKSQHLVLAAPVRGRPGEIQLIAPDAQIAFDERTADRLRQILREANMESAPPAISGVGRAFHVPGAIKGESETQIFLQTTENRPISLSIIRRPGEEPLVAVAMSEIVDEAAHLPEPETLLWYRLACGLPATLPAASIAEASATEASAISADYRLVKDMLGPCVRNRMYR